MPLNMIQIIHLGVTMLTALKIQQKKEKTSREDKQMSDRLNEQIVNSKLNTLMTVAVLSHVLGLLLPFPLAPASLCALCLSLVFAIKERHDIINNRYSVKTFNKVNILILVSICGIISVLLMCAMIIAGLIIAIHQPLR